MKNILVGYTGFVGSNLAQEFSFDGLFNSKNIEEAYGSNPNLLVYCGIPAQKFIANQNPEADMQVINQAIDNIQKINPQKIVLISTIDVYPNPNNVNEDSVLSQNEEAYGRDRYYLENWVKTNFNNYLIVRLPALYGLNLKKNFIYDLINVLPSMLKENKYLELSQKEPIISKYYLRQANGFYKCSELTKEEKNSLKAIFQKLNFTALNFTDSRATYQFYNLSSLWNHITIALDNNIKVLNLATQPITVQELYNYLYHKEFKNELNAKVAHYNFKTKYDYLFNGHDGYIISKEIILADIKKYIEHQTGGNL